LAEVQEMQVRLTKAGFDTGGTDGRVGNDTMAAIRDFQIKQGLEPADGYGGLAVLARLRQGG
jgi:membrane-bound lytic murein transglycosylase B